MNKKILKKMLNIKRRVNKKTVTQIGVRMDQFTHNYIEYMSVKTTTMPPMPTKFTCDMDFNAFNVERQFHEKSQIDGVESRYIHKRMAIYTLNALLDAIPYEGIWFKVNVNGVECGISRQVHMTESLVVTHGVSVKKWTDDISYNNDELTFSLDDTAPFFTEIDFADNGFNSLLGSALK